MNFTTSDLLILARTIFGEARGQAFEGQVAVAWVVRNRMARGKRFAPTISGVCLAHKQFSCWNRDDPTFVRMVTVELPDPAYVSAIAAAGMVLTERLPDPTFGADHYFTAIKPPSASVWPPRWALSMKRTAQIGDHVFYKEQT